MKHAGKMCLAMLAVAALLSAAPLQAAEQPPKPEGMKKLSFPSFQEFTTKNNIDVLVVEHREQPVATITMVFESGNALDPADKAGLSDFTINLINTGTKDKDSNQLAKWIESVGGSVFLNSGNDWCSINISILSEYIDTAFQYLQDIVFNATFPDDELEEYRKRIKTALEIELSQPGAVAERRFAEVVYGDHPYADNPTVASIEAISKKDVVDFYTKNYVANNTLVAVIGDVKTSDVKKLVDSYFGSWAEGAPATVAYAAPPAIPASRIYLYHKPGAVQTTIHVGHTGLKPDDQEWPKVTVANRILGGGSDARLFMNLREDKGWTYGAYSSYTKPKDIGQFKATVDVRTEVTDSAVVELIGELKRIANEPVTEDELNNAKNYLVGNFPLTIETPDQIASQVVGARLLGLGKKYLETYRERIAAVTVPDVQEAMRKYMHPDKLAIILVGDATAIHDKVAQIPSIKSVTVFDLKGNEVSLGALSVEPASYAYDASVLKDVNATYSLKMQTMDLGELNVAIKRVKSADADVIEVSSTLAGMLSLNQTVIFRADNLAPIMCKSSMTAGPNQMTSDLAFTGNKVAGTVKGMQDAAPSQVDKEVVAGTILNDQIEFALATLPLEVGTKYRFPVVETNSGAVSNVYTEVLSEEEVTVPAGTFKTYKIKIDMSDGQAFLYARKETPHLMVKHEIPAQALLIELKKTSK